MNEYTFNQCSNGHYYQGVKCSYCDMLKTQTKMCCQYTQVYQGISEINRMLSLGRIYRDLSKFW